MNCRYFRKEIEELRTEAVLSLSGQKHLEICRSCRTLNDENTQLRKLLKNLETVEAPNDFDIRLRSSIEAYESSVRKRFLSEILKPIPTAALASFLILTIFATLLINRSGDVAKKGSGVASTFPQTVGDFNILKKADANEFEAVLLPVTSDEKDEGVIDKNIRDHAMRGIKHWPIELELERVEGGNEFSLSKAVILEERDDSSANISVPVALQMPVAQKGLKVILRDEQGTPHLITTKAVSFGSQAFVGETANTLAGTNVSKEGVW